jgi:hypothetical protein
MLFLNLLVQLRQSGREAEPKTVQMHGKTARVFPNIIGNKLPNAIVKAMTTKK